MHHLNGGVMKFIFAVGDHTGLSEEKTCLCLWLRRLFTGCVRLPARILSLFISALLLAPSAD